MGEFTPRQKLFAAAWRGNGDELRSLVNSDAALVNARDENGVTALRFTAQYGHLALTEFLLDAGARTDLKAKDGITPLLSAVEQGHLEIVQLLIARGADVNCRTKENNCVLLAREKGHTFVEEELVRAGATESMGFMKDHKCSIM